MVLISLTRDFSIPILIPKRFFTLGLLKCYSSKDEYRPSEVKMFKIKLHVYLIK